MYAAPGGGEQVEATADALSADGRPRPDVTPADAKQLAEVATRMRDVFEAVHRSEIDQAAAEVNALLLDTNARAAVGQQR